MSKNVTIPTDQGRPFVVIYNGIKYVFTPGETVEVPQGIALVIEECGRWTDKYLPPENEGGGGGDCNCTPRQDGITPHIGANGNWYIGETDTGVNAEGNDGEDGKTPHIGANGNWFIGSTDTGVDAVGDDGEDGTSPTVTVSKSGKVTTITITDKNGKKTATINDGADGKTPVKGTDYFTSADKTELINAIKGSLTLGIASDGLIYLFVDGSPVGTGIPQGQSGDVFGYVDENNTIVLNGNLADGTYTIKYEMENGDVVDIGNMVLDSTVYYSVTSNLTNCTINNSAKTVAQGSGYSATITAFDGYELSSVVVTMGGSAVSVTNGVINIANVTGNIVITAVAEEVQTAEPVTVDIALTDGIRIGSDGGDRTLAGYCATEMIDLRDIPKPCAINLIKAQWCSDGTSSSVRYYVANASGTALDSGITTIGVTDYFTVVATNDSWADVTVTVVSHDVGYIRFSGYWANVNYSDNSSSLAAANTKATLTYTPN